MYTALTHTSAVGTAPFHQFWIPEATRQRMEEFGAPTVSDLDGTFLAGTKRVHAALTSVFMVFCVAMTGATGFGPFMGLSNLIFILGGVRPPAAGNQTAF